MRSVACAFIAAAATLQVAASTCQANVAQGVDAESFAKIKFDYLVIGMLRVDNSESEAPSYILPSTGGGTAGVTLSARYVLRYVVHGKIPDAGERLSEDPSLVVGLIEAGTTHFDDPMIDVPGIRLTIGRAV